MKEKTTFIYILKDPITNEVRYVGKSNKPKYRYNNHYKCVGNNKHKINWIILLKKDNLKPILEIIDEVKIDEWKEKEKLYIKKYIDMGCKLVNCTEGGDGLSYGNQTSFKKGHGMKKIVALNLNDGSLFKIFDSAKNAIDYFDYKKPAINHVLRKKFRKSCGYTWLYYDEYEKMNDDDIKKHIKWANYKKEITENSSWFKNKYERIYQYNLKTGELISEWNSAKDAAEKLKCLQSGILGCVNKQKKSAYGFYWSDIKKENYKKGDK